MTTESLEPRSQMNLRAGASAPFAMDPALASYVAAVKDDPDTLGVLLHGFRTDAQMHRIAEKLRAEYVAQIGHEPGPSEVASWQNSLMALSMLLDQAELTDHSVILEYQLGNTSPSTIGPWSRT